MRWNNIVVRENNFKEAIEVKLIFLPFKVRQSCSATDYYYYYYYYYYPLKLLANTRELPIMLAAKQALVLS
jgi:hypothetical protein